MKEIIVKIICSNFIGRIIEKFTSNKISYQNCIIDTNDFGISLLTKTMLFWGIYESAERRFIIKYLKNGDHVIELGASIGVISCIISKSIGPLGSCISIEANPELINTIKSNFSLNNIKNIEFINKAINYSVTSEPFVKFSISNDHLSSSTQLNNYSKKVRSVNVPTIQISDLISKKGNPEMILISDIEGSEVGFIMKELDLYSYFKLIIIELHDVYYENILYSVHDLKDLLVNKHGYIIKDSYGSVFVFGK